MAAQVGSEDRRKEERSRSAECTVRKEEGRSAECTARQERKRKVKGGVDLSLLVVFMVLTLLDIGVIEERQGSTGIAAAAFKSFFVVKERQGKPGIAAIAIKSLVNSKKNKRLHCWFVSHSALNFI